jgi:hypothetical protein
LTRSLSLDREENGHHHERNLTHLQVVNVMACEWGIRQAKTTTIATLKYCDYDHGLNFLVIFSGHLFVISVTSLLFSSTRVQHHFVNPCTSSMAILRLGPVFATSRSGRRASAFRFSPYKRPLKQALPTKPLSKPELCTEEESHHRNSNRNDMDGGIQVPQGRLFLNDFEKIDLGNPPSDHIQGLGTEAEPFYFLPDNSAVKLTRNGLFSATNKSHPEDEGEHLLSLSRDTNCQKYASNSSEGEPFFTSIYNLNFVKTFGDLPLNPFENSISEITGDVPYLRFSGPFKDGHIIALEERRYCCSPEPISPERGGRLDDTQNIMAGELEDLVRTSPKQTGVCTDVGGIDEGYCSKEREKATGKAKEGHLVSRCVPEIKSPCEPYKNVEPRDLEYGNGVGESGHSRYHRY